MRVVKAKRRGRRKARAFSSLQGVEFDIAAIKEIKRRKKGLCQRGSDGKV